MTMQERRNGFELKFVDRKVELDKSLLIMNLLDDVLREGLIYVVTYKRTVRKVNNIIM